MLTFDHGPKSNWPSLIRFTPRILISYEKASPNRLHNWRPSKVLVRVSTEQTDPIWPFSLSFRSPTFTLVNRTWRKILFLFIEDFLLVQQYVSTQLSAHLFDGGWIWGILDGIESFVDHQYIVITDDSCGLNVPENVQLIRHRFLNVKSTDAAWSYEWNKSDTQLCKQYRIGLKRTS